MDRLLKKLFTPLVAQVTGQTPRSDGSYTPITATVESQQVQLALAGQEVAELTSKYATLQSLYQQNSTDLVQAKAQIAATQQSSASMNGTIVTLQQVADSYTAAKTASENDRLSLHATDAAQAQQLTALLARAALSYMRGNTAVTAPKVWVSSPAATDSTGVATVVMPNSYFSQVHVALPVVVRATTDPKLFCTAFVQTPYATTVPPSIKVQVAESKTTGVLVLNTMVEGLEPSPAGLSVYLFVLGN